MQMQICIPELDIQIWNCVRQECVRRIGVKGRGDMNKEGSRGTLLLPIPVEAFHLLQLMHFVKCTA